MMNSIVIFFRFLLTHKWKIALTSALTVLFLVLLFPLSDLNDLISSQISKLTNNNVFLEFENMHMNPLTATISLEKVYIETPHISGLSSEEVSVSPSISALIMQNPGGKLSAKGLLKGELELSIDSVSAENGVKKSKLDLVANNLNLSEASQVANIDLPIKGQLSLTTQALADLSMSDQPEMDVNLTVLKFELSSTMLPLRDFGQISLPEIKLGKVELKGRLSNGKFLIENGKLGTPQDEFYGDVKGDIAVTFQNIGGQITPIIGSYNISLDIKATEVFKAKAQLLLSFLDGYKAASTGNISNYKFKIYADRMGGPPQFSPLK